MATAKGGKRSPKTSSKAKQPAPPKTKSVVFSCVEPQAQSVALVGEFNTWNQHAHPMKKNKDGSWTVSIKLKPGSYQYKFVVDGTWREDHANPNRTWDAQGICNSVIEVT